MTKGDREMPFGKTVTRPATADDAASLVILGERLAKTDPFLVVSGFDPVTGADLIRSAIDDGTRTESSRIFVAANEIEREASCSSISSRSP